MAAPPPLDSEPAPPEAASLVESLRAFSYELPSAIADVVDNSITAKAKNVWVDFFWDGSASVIAITDDGMGMSESQLRQAMRPGSRSPLLDREPHDLGRFGLGLKTASFSQCRRVTVRSRPAGGIASTRCWDLDHVIRVNDWQLLLSADPESEPHFSRLAEHGRGTVVVWQKMDRLVAGQQTTKETDQAHFYERAGLVKQHLGMVFHQLMSGPNRINLFLNGNPIEAWDPFLAGEHATQGLGLERLEMRGHVVEVEPFVLPHHSKLSKLKHDAAAGPRQWNAHQGFYVYRNRRLLVAGDWLGLGWAKEEHYKLARIRLEIPNALDHDWGIDVTKSRALPPARLRGDLRRIGEKTRREAKRVYSHRGSKLTKASDEDKLFLWEPMVKHDRTFYRLNRDHPLLRRVQSSSNDVAAIKALLRLIEETVPLPHITITNSERPDSLAAPFEGTNDNQVREIMEQALRSLLQSGHSREDALNRLKLMWPFEQFPAILQTLAEQETDD